MTDTISRQLAAEIAGGFVTSQSHLAPSTQHPAPRVDVSILVPAKDEADNLAPFMEQAAAAFAADPGTRYEVVVIDDGSTDDSARILRELETRHDFLRVARHRSQRGIADALRTG